MTPLLRSPANDVPTAPANGAFDASLPERNPAWDARRREDVPAQATLAGLHLQARHAMPSNNLLPVWALRTTGTQAALDALP